MRRLAPFALIGFGFLFGSTLGHAQSFSEYLKMRQRHGIVRATDAVVLDSFVGSKPIEISTVVKGSMKLDGHVSLFIQREDGKPFTVDTVATSDWLVGNEVPARLLVRAIRPEPQAALRLVLIGAAPEADVRRIEVEQEKRAAAAAEAKAKAEAARKARESREVTPEGSPLFGPIGKPATPAKPRRGRNWRLPISEVTPIYASFMKRVNPRLRTGQALEIAQAVVGLSLHYKVDARLVMAVLMVESGFKPNVVSHSGAMGLGQLMPDTARGLGVQNPFDTTENLYGSVKLLRQNLDKYRRVPGGDFRSLVLCLAAYNAGPGAVRRHGGVPPYRETQRYVQKVVDLYFRLAGA